MVKKFFLLLFLIHLHHSDCLPLAKAVEHQPFPMLVLPDGTEIIIKRIFRDSPSQNKGLSGVKSESFGTKEGALFLFDKVERRSFWMPETHFDLDVVFIDENWKVTAIEKNIPHHPSRKGNIPRIPPHRSKHVLEIKAKTPLARKIKKGMIFKIRGSLFSHGQTKSSTHP